MTAVRQTRTVVFREASPEDERMAAVLISKDANTGALKAIVADVPGRNQPDPEIVALLTQSVELANL